jgi:hypothetical protein
MLLKRLFFYFLLLTGCILSCTSCNQSGYHDSTVTSYHSNSDNMSADSIFNQIDQAKTPYKKAKSALENMNNREIQVSKDSLMDYFYDFLLTDESYAMSEGEFEELSEGICRYDTSDFRIITFECDNSAFGESGAPIYSYIQYKTNHKTNVYCIYCNSSRRITSVYQPDSNRIILAGTEKEVRPWRAFVISYFIENDSITKLNILMEYDNHVWKTDSSTGLIYRIDDMLTETFINNAINDTIVVSSNDNQTLLLKYNTISCLYEIQQ